MKIYVLGSNSFVHKMVECKNKLRVLGYDGWIHQDYEDHVLGEKRAFLQNASAEENAEYKKTHDYIRIHYKHILESDAILIVNLEKRGIENYIGGNCLMEMSQAYVNNKKIFLLNDIPQNVPYYEEIKAMDPVCLRGKLEDISLF
ncbi:MAG: hypothetical protein MUF50_00710 [Planctomycetes bacterium]|jgi:hypothetical protein|nr:hypothetical protein [Planctomycetota bacterium]